MLKLFAPISPRYARSSLELQKQCNQLNICETYFAVCLQKSLISFIEFYECSERLKTKSNFGPYRCRYRQRKLQCKQ